MSEEILKVYFYKDNFGNYVISELEDLGFGLEFEELNLLTKSLNIVGNYIEKTQQENERLKHKLEMKSGSVLAQQNIRFCEENTELKAKLSSIEEYISPLIEQVKTNYPNEVNSELLLTHLNIIKSKLEILRGNNND